MLEFLGGIAIGISIFVAERIVLKLKNKSSPLEKGIESFQGLDSFICPKCKHGWRNESIAYCECLEYYTGHFHMICDGKSGYNKIGCKYKWLMRSAK